MKTSTLNFEEKARYLRTKIIFHIDMDAFFASCIELKEPKLKNQPLVIGNSSLRSIVTTCNYVARRWNIKTGMPLYKAKKLCPQLIVREPDFDFFSQQSASLWALLKRFTPRLETISIDEAYLDVTKTWSKYGSPQNLAQIIQRTILTQLNLSCSIGIAPNKFLAKMASEWEKPKGITTLFPSELKEKLWPLPIEQMWGAGYATCAILKNKYKILTIGDLAQCDYGELSQHFSKTFLSLYNHANGNCDDKINPYRQLPKSIGNEITLDWPVNEWDGIHEILWILTKNVLIRLKKSQLLARTINVSLRYQWKKGHEDFDKQKHHQRHTHQLTLTHLTDDLELIFVQVKSLFSQLYQAGRPLALISVSLHNLVPNQHFHQANWQEHIELQRPELNQMVTNLNHKFQKQVAFLGSNLVKSELVLHQNYADQATHKEIRNVIRHKK